MTDPRIYVASKSKHGARWVALRDSGVPLISTWIDEWAPGQTTCRSDLYDRCIREASSCDALIVYAEAGEHLKGALLE